MQGPEKITNKIVDKGKPEQKQESGKTSRKTGRSEKVTKKELGKERPPSLNVARSSGSGEHGDESQIPGRQCIGSEKVKKRTELTKSLSFTCIQDFTVRAVKYCLESFPFIDIPPPYV